MNFEKIFYNSYQRNVIDKSDLFFPLFYKNFIASSTLVREAFKSTNMERQKDMLEDSLRHLVDFASSKESSAFLQSLAIVHKKVNNIDNQMYDLWLNSILATIQEIDPDYDRNEMLAWKIMLSPGIEFMKEFSTSHLNSKLDM